MARSLIDSRICPKKRKPRGNLSSPTGIATATENVLQTLGNLESRRMHWRSAQRGDRYAAATNVLARTESQGLSVLQEDGTQVGHNMKMLAPRPFFGS